MSQVIIDVLPALMFVGLALLLLSGIPVAFGLAACGMLFAVAGIELGLLTPALLQALPLRLFGIMSNETLLAIPFFTFMGLLLEKSGMAEDLLETVGQVFGGVRGGLAFAVVLVGALLAATTGVVAASVISMGLISLPVMLRYGYNRQIATGVIAAAGSLAQVIPPSLVLIVMADQLGRSVGDMYAGALVPAALLVGLYLALVAFIAMFFGRTVPALPSHALADREHSGASGLRSLALLAGVSGTVGWGALQLYPDWLIRIGRAVPPSSDELVIVGIGAAVMASFFLSLLDHMLRLQWLSALARRVAFVLIPPLILIFLVLGTIFLGVATPTEGGAHGRSGCADTGAAPAPNRWQTDWPHPIGHHQTQHLRDLYPGGLYGFQLDLPRHWRGGLGGAFVRPVAWRLYRLHDFRYRLDFRARIFS